MKSSDDAYDELNPREEAAARALKSAVIGFFICPLQLYTAWLILMVLLADEPLRPRYFWSAIVATIVLLTYSLIVGIVINSLSDY